VKNMNEKNVNNSDLLLIYGAKLNNPNGDPDAENKPRIDLAMDINYVTDGRLKRYIRDYVIDRFDDKHVWVSKVNGKVVNAEERFNALENAKSETDVLKACIDTRLFGATMAIKEKQKKEKGDKKPEAPKAVNEQKKAIRSITGAVQFSWGSSLHTVELVDSPGISSTFYGREARDGMEQHGTIGKDWRLYYSLIAFRGTVSGFRARKTMLRESDVRALDDFTWIAIKEETKTRSKLGHAPHLYLRVEFTDDETDIGDLREYLDVTFEKHVRDIADINIDYSRLVKVLIEHSDVIQAVFIRESGRIVSANKKSFEDNLKNTPLEEKIHCLPHKWPEPINLLTIP